MGSFKSEPDNLYSLKEKRAVLKAFLDSWLALAQVLQLTAGHWHASCGTPCTNNKPHPVTKLIVRKSDWPSLMRQNVHSVTITKFCFVFFVFFWMGLPMSNVFYKLFPKWICGAKKCNWYGKGYIWHDRLFFYWVWDELRWPRGDLATLLSLISVHRWRIILKPENFARPQSDSVDTGNQK